MTALEKLIKLASTDASELYRRTAREAQVEVELADAMLDNMMNACMDNMEGADGDEFKYQEELMNALGNVRVALGQNPKPSGLGGKQPNWKWVPTG